MISAKQTFLLSVSYHEATVVSAEYWNHYFEIGIFQVRLSVLKNWPLNSQQSINSYLWDIFLGVILLFHTNLRRYLHWHCQIVTITISRYIAANINASWSYLGYLETDSNCMVNVTNYVNN